MIPAPLILIRARARMLPLALLLTIRIWIMVRIDRRVFHFFSRLARSLCFSSFPQPPPRFLFYERHNDILSPPSLLADRRGTTPLPTDCPRSDASWLFAQPLSSRRSPSYSLPPPHCCCLSILHFPARAASIDHSFFRAAVSLVVDPIFFFLVSRRRALS